MNDKRYIPLIGIYWCTFEIAMYLQTKKNNSKTGENVISYGMFVVYHIAFATIIAWFYLMLKIIFV